MNSCSGVAQGPFHLGNAGHVERRHAAAVRGAGVGSVADKKPDELELPAIDGTA